MPLAAAISFEPMGEPMSMALWYFCAPVNGSLLQPKCDVIYVYPGVGQLMMPLNSPEAEIRSSSVLENSSICSWAFSYSLFRLSACWLKLSSRDCASSRFCCSEACLASSSSLADCCSARLASTCSFWRLTSSIFSAISSMSLLSYSIIWLTMSVRVR